MAFVNIHYTSTMPLNCVYAYVGILLGFGTELRCIHGMKRERNIGVRAQGCLFVWRSVCVSVYGDLCVCLYLCPDSVTSV